MTKPLLRHKVIPQSMSFPNKGSLFTTFISPRENNGPSVFSENYEITHLCKGNMKNKDFLCNLIFSFMKSIKLILYWRRSAIGNLTVLLTCKPTVYSSSHIRHNRCIVWSGATLSVCVWKAPFPVTSHRQYFFERLRFKSMVKTFSGPIAVHQGD